MSLEEGGHRDRITRESNRLIDDLETAVAPEEVAFETSTIVSTRSFEEVFDRARRTRPDLVVMGWGNDRVWHDARAERPLDELTNRLPADFLVVKDRGLDCSRVLVPTVGGPDSELSAEVAVALRSAVGADVSLLRVVDGPDERGPAESFLAEWGAENGLADARLVVDESGDVEAAIEREAADHSLVLIGATEKGMLARLVTDSLHYDVVNDVNASVVLAERPSERTFLQRLVGRGDRERDRDRNRNR
jgi:nucleotide-binding universal stress UspA family protein